MKAALVPGTDLAIRCACGELRGVVHGVSPAEANHVVCYCRYCEAYARELGRAGEILDEWGGTERFQVSPAALEITGGAGRIECMRLTPKGALRWYAGCCNTPVAITLPSSSVPFLAMDACCVDRRALRAPLDSMVGPIRARVNRRFPAEQAGPMAATFGALLRMLAHFAPMLFRWWWRGDHRRWVLFDRASGAPVVAPRLVATSHLPAVVARREEERARAQPPPAPRRGAARPARGCG